MSESFQQQIEKLFYLPPDVCAYMDELSKFELKRGNKQISILDNLMYGVLPIYSFPKSKVHRVWNGRRWCKPEHERKDVGDDRIEILVPTYPQTLSAFKHAVGRTLKNFRGKRGFRMIFCVSSVFPDFNEVNGGIGICHN